MPVFPVKPGLLHRAFLPNPDMMYSIRRLVPQADAAALEFFAGEENVRELDALTASYEGNMGRFESDAERRERMWREIAGGKTELEGILRHSVSSFCWPWGQYCPEAHELAREAGFSPLFTTKEGPNLPTFPLTVHRFKGKSNSGSWLVSRLRLYASPFWGAAYACLRNLF